MTGDKIWYLWHGTKLIVGGRKQHEFIGRKHRGPPIPDQRLSGVPRTKHALNLAAVSVATNQAQTKGDNQIQRQISSTSQQGRQHPPGAPQPARVL